MKLSTLVLPAFSLLFAGPASVVGSEAVGNEGKHPSLRREQQPSHANISSLQEQMEALIRRLDEKDVHEQALMRRLDEQDAELQELRRHVASGPVGGGRNLQETLILTQDMVDDLTALLAALTAFDGNDAGEQFSNAIATPVELDRIREVLRYLVPNGDLGQVERLAALDTDSLIGLDRDQLETVAINLDKIDPDGLSAITMPGVVEKLQGLTGCLQWFAETDEVIVQGCDFIIRGNGGSTSVDPTTVPGKGNLIVGWNEGESTTKTGLNNLVVGSGHAYTSTGGAVFGNQNTISASFATVSGGTGNTASSAYATVSGGIGNAARGDAASVSGGNQNSASGFAASVSGGNSNRASALASSISGGKYNEASGLAASVSGGQSNIANGEAASVSGGIGNYAAGEASSVSGGTD